MKKNSKIFDVISLIIAKFEEKYEDAKLFFIFLFALSFIFIITIRCINNSFSIFF